MIVLSNLRSQARGFPPSHRFPRLVIVGRRPPFLQYESTVDPRDPNLHVVRLRFDSIVDYHRVLAHVHFITHIYISGEISCWWMAISK